MSTLQSHHYEALSQLRFAKSAEDRKQAQRLLIDLEGQGEFTDEDLIELLGHEDAVFQVYAIQAIARRKSQKVSDNLNTLYGKTQNPIILTELLSAFNILNTDRFIKAVVRKLKKTNKNRRLIGFTRGKADGPLVNESIHDQIIIPSLKYLQGVGNSKITKVIKPYLNNDDSNVRWHALALFDRLSLPIDERIINRIKDSDPSRLVREQAAIILEKRS